MAIYETIVGEPRPLDYGNTWPLYEMDVFVSPPFILGDRMAQALNIGETVMTCAAVTENITHIVINNPRNGYVSSSAAQRLHAASGRLKQYLDASDNPETLAVVLESFRKTQV